MARFASNEARQHWNDYNKKYAKTNYKTVSMKLGRYADADVITYLEGEQAKGRSVKDVVVDLVRKELKG